MPKSPPRPAGWLFALLSALLVLGSAYLALHENRAFQAQASIPTTPPLTFPTPVLLTPGQPTPVSPPSAPTETLAPPASCMPPEGWTAIPVQTGDTLESLAVQYGTTLQALTEANCLRSDRLPAGALLYVPGTPPTPMAAQCGPPPGWVFYTVKPGENLFRIGLAFGVNVTTMQAANCMGNSTYIRAGQRLYVPNVPTRTPPPATATRTPHPTATFSPTPVFTPTPLPTIPATPTTTFTPVYTSTPFPTATSAITPTLTPTPPPPTATPLPPTPTATFTVSPTTPAGTPTSAPTSTPTWTPTPTPTLFLLPTPTP